MFPLAYLVLEFTALEFCAAATAFVVLIKTSLDAVEVGQRLKKAAEKKSG